jgi:FG-GAP repeat
VYVFRRTGTAWEQEAYLKASNASAYDAFGYSVALSGDTLAVGADGEDSAAQGADGDQADNTVPDSGAVYVFRRTALPGNRTRTSRRPTPALSTASPTAGSVERYPGSGPGKRSPDSWFSARRCATRRPGAKRLDTRRFASSAGGTASPAR